MLTDVKVLKCIKLTSVYIYIYIYVECYLKQNIAYKNYIYI